MSSQAKFEQKKIYVKGIGGERPLLPLSYEEMKRQAKDRLSPEGFAYICGGAGREETQSANRRAFQQWEILPSMLNGKEDVDTSIELLGKKQVSPYFLAPIGVLDMARAKGDLKVAEAAAAEQVPLVMSNQASAPMEACAERMGDAERWFQLYYSRSQDLVQSLVQRAEAAGCSCLVVTLDTTQLGWRRRDLDLGFLPFLQGKGIAQYTSDPEFQRLLDEEREPEDENAIRPRINIATLKTLWSQKRNYPGDFKKWFSSRPSRAVQQFISIFSRPDLSWKEIELLRSYTDLPIVLKGIQTVSDAKMAKDKGMDALYISNHGGRQVDGACAALDQLYLIRKAVGEEYPLLFDSGVRSGADAMKALCLGATAVGIGRPYVYALALQGEKGVRQMLRYYRAELEQNMFLSGCTSMTDLSPEVLRSTRSQ